jgi:hypothetical protein
MSASFPAPTPYPEVNAAVNLLLDRARVILEGQFIGLYLGGSLALGDFDPATSDIDFIIVTTDDLRGETVVVLEEMHRRLWATGLKWAKRMEGSYVPQQTLRRWSPDDAPCPFMEDGELYLTNQGSAVVQRHILHKHGVLVAGPPPSVLIDPVDAGELRRAAREMLERSWQPLLDDPAWLRQSKYQSFGILTLCRTLYILEHGAVGSKPVAARWAQHALDQRWIALINWALAWRPESEASQLEPTLDFIRYALARCGRDNDLA